MADDFQLPADPASAWAAAPSQPLVDAATRAMLTQVFELPPAGEGDAAAAGTSAGSAPGAAAATLRAAAPPSLAVAPSRLPQDARAALAAALGAEHVRVEDAARAAHANGMSYLDLVRRRRAREGGEAPPAPTRCSRPPTRGRSPRCWGSAQNSASRSSRSAAARASSAA